MTKEQLLMERVIDCSSLVNQETPRYWVVHQIKYDFESGGWYSVKDLSKTSELKKYGTPYGAKKYALNLYHKHKKELGEDLEVCIKEELVDVKDYNKLKQQLALTEKALEKLRWKPKEVADYIQDITYCYAKVDNKMLHINRDKFDEIIKQAKEMMKSE